MYKIKLKFKSDVKGIHTIWEETSDNEFFFHLKLDRMLNHWLSVLVKEPVKYTNNIFSDDKICVMKKKYEIIQRQIELMNCEGAYEQRREFIINFYQGDNYDKLLEFQLF